MLRRILFVSTTSTLRACLTLTYGSQIVIVLVYVYAFSSRAHLARPYRWGAAMTARGILDLTRVPGPRGRKPDVASRRTGVLGCVPPSPPLAVHSEPGTDHNNFGR